MIFWLFISCSDSSSSAEKNDDYEKALVYQELYSDYQSWAQPEEWSGIVPSQSVHGSSVQIWLNETAFEAIENGNELSSGAAIMKQGYVDEEGTQLQNLTLMVKEDGYASQTGDWFWASYSDSNEVLEYGSPDFCISCHQSSNSDYILFVEE